jgi:hypothetical protein
MVAIIIEVLSLVVLPMVLNKTTEDRFHGIKPHLREIWFVIAFVYTTYALFRPESERYFMLLKRGFGATYPMQSYILAALLGVVLFTGYWWFLGVILPTNVSGSEMGQQGETKKPETQQSNQGTNNNNTNIVGNNNTVTIGDPKVAVRLNDIIRLLKTQGDKVSPKNLLARYPLGYTIFDVDYTNSVYPYQSRALDRWDFDWSVVTLRRDIQSGKAADTLRIRIPDIQGKNGRGPKIMNVNIGGTKKVGSFDGIIFSDGIIDMKAEILAIRDDGIVFLIGFTDAVTPK